MKHKNAFTLVELLAVIVILAVIALIATPIVLNSIKASEIGAFKNSVIIASKSLDYYLLDNGIEDIPYEGIEVTNLSVQTTLISGKYVKEDGQIVATLITDGKYCAYGTMDDLLIEEDCSDLDATPPEVDDTNFILTSTSSTVRVVLNNNVAEDTESGIKKYTLNLYQGQTFIESKELTEIGEYTFTGLTKDTEYKVKLIVLNNKNGKTTTEKNIRTEDIDVPTYEVSPEGWATSKTVTIAYPSGYTNEYSLDGGKNWDPYTEAVLFTSNGTIIARVNDGTNYVTGSSQTVSQIDNEIPTVSVSGMSTEYVASDDVTLTLEDSGSGVSYWCVVTEDDSSSCSWNSITNSTSTTATYTARSNGTYYAFAKDYLGNVSESYEFEISKIGSISGTPTLTASWPSTSEIKVVVSGMTSTGDTVSYRYSINGTVKQDWTTDDNYTFTGLTSGTGYTIKVETKLTNIGITGNSKTATIYTSKTVSTTGSSYSSSSSCTSSTYTFAASGVYPSKTVTASSCSSSTSTSYSSWSLSSTTSGLSSCMPSNSSSCSSCTTYTVCDTIENCNATSSGGISCSSYYEKLTYTRSKTTTTTYKATYSTIIEPSQIIY